MGVFSQKTKIKVAPPTIRVETVVVAPPPSRPKPKPKPSSSSLSSRHLNGAAGAGAGLRSASSARSSPAATVLRKSASPYPSSADERRGDRKRKLAARSTSRPSPASERVEFGEDDSGDEDDDWEDALDARKRRRRAAMNGDRRVDLNRKLRHESLPSPPGDEAQDTVNGGKKKEGGAEQRIRMVHAVDVASLALKCVPSFGPNTPPEELAVELRYPGTAKRERYELVWGKDKIDAVKDIIRIVKHVAETYLTDEEARPFLDQNSGIVRQLERASSRNVLDLTAFKDALNDYNERILRLHRDGTIARNLDVRHDLPAHLVAFILDQVYDRTVAQKVELLAKYENGTDNVYGELLHPFISNILVERLKMTSDQVFVDLGSGVGNVVLQAALEIGCESWGDEMMENACNLAEAQQREFAARCRLWGIRPGKVVLERGDFRTNAGIQKVLQRADVVLVNNQAFTSQLNDDLVRMFLDLKSGCKIISLKSFVHDYKSAAYNVNDVGSTILDVEELTYPEGYVSWTGAGGFFCISTRK